MSAIKKSLYVALAELVRRNIHTFTPRVIAGEVSVIISRPEDDILGEVMRECEQLVRKRLLWSPSSQPYLREHTSLVAKPDELLPILDQETGMGKFMPV